MGPYHAFFCKGKRYNMNVSKEREHGVSSSEVTLSDPHDNKTRAVQ